MNMNDRFQLFFRGIERSGSSRECLIFTTFTFDEAVLKILLEKYKVPHTKRVVVFHDVLRHRNPGLLSAYYPQSTVYSVILKENKGKRVCPIFHSKIWARVDYSSNPPMLKNLAVGSLNLTSYHLMERDRGTFESFVNWDIPVRNGATFPANYFLFKKRLVFPATGIKSQIVIEEPPATIIISARSGLRIDTSESKAVCNIIKSEAKNWGNAILCAAPFVSKAALKKVGIDDTRVYSNRDKTGRELHAKIISYQKATILGSPNLTMQALGAENGLVNHETIVIARKLLKSDISKLKNFTQLALDSCNDKSPGDEDRDDPLPHEYGGWIAERNWKINAPREAILVIDKEGKRAYIKFTDKVQGSRVWIASKGLLHNGVYLYIRKSRRTAFPRRAEEKDFAKIISQGPAEITSKAKGKIVWKLDLNFGDYWPSLELRRRYIRPGNGGNGDGEDGPHLSKGSIFDSYDVRDLRLMAIKEPTKGRALGPFARWLSRYEINVAHIPIWCDRIAEQLYRKRKTK